MLRLYVRACVCHVRNQSLTTVTIYIQIYMQVYLHIYIHIHVQVAHNFDTFYATKLKFGMIFTQTKTLAFIVELPLGPALGGPGVRMGLGKDNSHTAIWAKAIGRGICVLWTHV